ncbi:MAG: DNA internalization-related competence protein ComEC/Rec2 [Pseudomonadota bacterium]
MSGRLLAAYVAGLLALQLSPSLPSVAACLALGSLPIAVFSVAHRTHARWGLLLAPALGGLWWAAMSGALLLAQRPVLPPRGETTTLVVRIADFPQSREGGQRLLADVVEAPAGIGLSRGARLRIADYGTGRVYQPGEIWRLRLRLRAPHGLRNPGTFDYETWLFQQGIVATASVREDAANARVASASPGLARLRTHLAQRIGQALAGHPQTGLVRALALGDQGAITPEQWAVFRDTGTAHLAVVSGQHILMAAAPAYGLTRWLWPRLPALALRLAAPRAAALALFGAAFAYGLLAGLTVPTQRALIMLAVFTSAVWWRRERSAPRLLLGALALVLTLDPRAALAPGTWLSFGAVACLYAGFGGRLGRLRPWQVLWQGQWVVTLGLAPVLLLAFGRLSWVAPAVNLMLIPVFSIVLLPSILAGTLLAVIHPALGAPVLGLAAALLSGLWTPWTLIAAWPGAASSLPMPGLLAAGMMLAGTLWSLAPRGFPGRGAGLLLVLVVLLRPSWRPEHGALEAVMLDVGQGEAIILRTARHALLYDTGPRMGASDAVEWLIAPYLRGQGIARLDRVIISHPDSDHSGGAERLRRVMPVADWLSGGPAPYPGTHACRAGMTWDWDGVRFEILHPDAGYRGPDNDGACVLRVLAPGGRLLIVGDLERAGEVALLDRGAEVQADVLVVGHHGSAGASSPAFLAAVGPRWALVPAGYGNRWGFPAAAVRQRLARQGSMAIVSGEHGAVRVLFDRHRPMSAQALRCRQARYWHAPAHCPALADSPLKE